MSEELDSNTSGNPSGKTKGIIGFVLALAAILCGTWLLTLLGFDTTTLTFSKGPAMAALILPILAIVISVMGMKACKAAGEKKGLAMAGMIIGIVAFIWMLITIFTLSAASGLMGEGFENLKDSLDQLENLNTQ